MRIHNLYTDANGESHFRDIESNGPRSAAAAGSPNACLPNGIILRDQSGERPRLAPGAAPQYIVNLDAGVRITASDGESRVIGAGEVLLSRTLPARTPIAGSRPVCATACSFRSSRVAMAIDVEKLRASISAEPPPFALTRLDTSC